jgi:hypothetical protein
VKYCRQSECMNKVQVQNFVYLCLTALSDFSLAVQHVIKGLQGNDEEFTLNDAYFILVHVDTNNQLQPKTQTF